MKRALIAIAAIVLVLSATVYLAFAFSPLPSVFVIRYMFSSNTAGQVAALERHVPEGIAAQYDLAYGPGADEKFDIFYPEGTDTPLPTLVWVHGGAWIAGTKSDLSGYLQILAAEGYTTVGIDYTVAPQAIYPGPVVQTNAAFAHLAENAERYNIDPARLMIAGDSAGAQIAAQFANIVTSPDYADLVGIAPAIAPDQLAGAILFCGAYQLEGIDLDGDFGWFLRTVLWAYTGVRDFMNDPEFRQASVTNFVTGDFPPAFISAGNGDPLNPQSIRLAERLSAHGVPVQALFFAPDHTPAQPHEYQFSLDTAEAQQALAALKAFLAERIAADQPN